MGIRVRDVNEIDPSAMYWDCFDRKEYTGQEVIDRFNSAPTSIAAILIISAIELVEPEETQEH